MIQRRYNTAERGKDARGTVRGRGGATKNVSPSRGGGRPSFVSCRLGYRTRDKGMGEIKRFLFSLLKVKKRKFMRLWKS